ncbi:zinc-binding dehydrogenase [Sphingorhabdus sp. Alg239-R122]|uniref:zinc-binding dehydrogenase n=1 Tax=Sphingorhabdus sp. Alg239-R122 TaxID=2305989 RepID=UPI0019686318|nr:zinc-binding dehydrogenase [Sphingorhabdus sp. Alg239-R122]
MADTMKQIFSTLHEDGTLEVALREVPVPVPGLGEVLIKVGASPVNPSDLGVMFSVADVDNAEAVDGDLPALKMQVHPGFVPRLGNRIGQDLSVGNEGAGTVIDAGDDSGKPLIGKKVCFFGGGSYAEYRCIPVMQCLPLGDDADLRDGASSFVNPMTAQSMIETMKLEGHSGLVHTAAASNLGQMLVKLCQADNVPLVNIVRKQEQVDILKGLGAEHVVNSSDDDFMPQLVTALKATGATLAFDATGGGDLASNILNAMEIVASADMEEYSVYGSSVMKQVYIYGGLDMSPTMLNRGFGMVWSIGGWLLPPFLQRLGMEGVIRLRTRVASELTTTFASNYSHEISLADALSPDIAKGYNGKKTGEKYLIVQD